VSTVLRTTKECRSVYRDILQGHSFVSERGFYIKHYNESDLGYLENAYQNSADEATSMGFMSKKEKLDFLEKEDYWSKDEEDEYITATFSVNDASAHYEKLVIPEQKAAFEKIMEEQRKKLEKIGKTRNELVEPTVESYCDKIINELYVLRALYKDPELTKPAFSQEEFDDLSYRELGDVVRTYNKSIGQFTEINIKKIAVNSFFLNAFLMSDNDPVKFYGKSVLEMTIYQMNLFSRGKFYKSILTEGSEPPSEYYDDEINGITNLVSWFDAEHGKIMGKRQAQQSKMKQSSGKRRRR